MRLRPWYSLIVATWHDQLVRGWKRLVPGDGTGGRTLSQLGVLEGQDGEVWAAICARLVILSSVEGTVRGDGADSHTDGYPAEQVERHGWVTDVATGDLRGTEFQHLFRKTDMNFTPRRRFAPMLAGVSPHLPLKPVLSIGQVTTPADPRQGTFAPGISWRLLGGLKSSTARSIPAGSSMKPAVYRSAMPDGIWARQVLICDGTGLWVPSTLAGPQLPADHLGIEPELQKATLLRISLWARKFLVL